MEERTDYQIETDDAIPGWTDIPLPVRRAMATVLVYMNKNNLGYWWLDCSGKNGFLQRRTHKEYLEIQETNNPTPPIGSEKDGYIYLIGSEINTYKIGRAKEINQRVNTFGVKLPIETWLIHSFKSGDYIKAEKILHERYASKRKHGEWFSLDTSDVEAIKAIGDYGL